MICEDHFRRVGTEQRSVRKPGFSRNGFLQGCTTERGNQNERARCIVLLQFNIIVLYF